jgi:hypothetical protein
MLTPHSLYSQLFGIGIAEYNLIGDATQIWLCYLAVGVAAGTAFDIWRRIRVRVFPPNVFSHEAITRIYMIGIYLRAVCLNSLLVGEPSFAQTGVGDYTFVLMALLSGTISCLLFIRYGDPPPQVLAAASLLMLTGRDSFIRQARFLEFPLRGTLQTWNLSIPKRYEMSDFLFYPYSS